MRATEIAALLSRQVEGVVRLLLPNGKRVGQEWRVGSTDGEAGKSMGVHMTGDKAGVWLDGDTGQAGDLVGLWMAVKGVGLREACKEAMDYLGLREDRLDAPPKSYTKPSKQGVSRLSDEHRAWLTDVRKIDAQTIEVYRLASRDGWLMFPYLRDGELVAAKYRKLPKDFRQDAGCEPCLFGWQAYTTDSRIALICEGELDALAWNTYGIPALSVPMGGGAGAKHGWVEAEFERLSLLDTIYLSMDSDKAGQEAVRDLVERLGRERVRVVNLPRKDANDCLMAGVPKADMLAALRDAKTCDPSELRDIGEFEDAIWEEYGRKDSGLRLPWSKTHDAVRLRPGETSIWAGVNGHGKSTLLSHIVGGMGAQGVRVCVASMEYRPALWMMRMNRQVAGVAQPSEQFCRHVTRAMAGNVKAFAVSGAAKSSRIIEVFRYARRRYQTELFVIDNLTKCGFADDDYPGQKAFVEAISDFARDEQTHVAIVAHMRKGDTEMAPAGKSAIKGSGGIADMADTVFEVWRNKPKEKAAEIAASTGAAMDAKYDGKPDVLLICHKQRFNGLEPSVALWYDAPTTQYLAGSSHRPRPAVETPVSVSGVAI
ncbi:MAG: toprim domain-containing protein [Pseudomonadota bacterium]|nr:toprim domain-containing protein [Pseudomonadota bacterium]